MYITEMAEFAVFAFGATTRLVVPSTRLTLSSFMLGRADGPIHVILVAEWILIGIAHIRFLARAARR